MKTNTQSRIIRLSLVTLMLLGSSAYAGKLITDAVTGAALETVTSTPGQQFGFGGWDMSNINVLVTDLDYNNSVSGLFDESTGTYSGMGTGKSFEAEITTENEIRGRLHGKDWPVGEPSGIKVINDDLLTKHGKPHNCIMTSSYLAEGYLDAGNKPVLCSSSFQTHKRFKINLQPNTVDNITSGEGWGKPVDILFNLEADDTSTVRYQVLQKINNYTGKRLSGFKVEILNEDNTTNPALTISIGTGEGLDKDGNPDGDIWGTEDMANFSHGLWGAKDSGDTGREEHFAENGFFDATRAYYESNLSTGAYNISYTGPMLGGNYQAKFGNWLPSAWQPTGIFHDDDQDPETDGILKAYWGDPSSPTGTANKWHKGNDDGFALATEEDLLLWDGEWFDQEAVEDVLNLGLNYIVVIGDNTQIPNNTFKIRITPYVAADQTSPSYVGGTIPTAEYGETGTVADTSEGIVTLGLIGDLEG